MYHGSHCACWSVAENLLLARHYIDRYLTNHKLDSFSKRTRQIAITSFNICLSGSCRRRISWQSAWIALCILNRFPNVPISSSFRDSSVSSRRTSPVISWPVDKCCQQNYIFIKPFNLVYFARRTSEVMTDIVVSHRIEP